MLVKRSFTVITNLYKNVSIKSKIFLCNVIIVIIPLMILAFFTNMISTQAIIDKAIKNSIRELTLIDKNLETLTNAIEDYVRILSTDYRLQNTMKEIKTKELNSLEEIDVTSTLSEVLSNFLPTFSYLLQDGQYIQA